MSKSLTTSKLIESVVRRAMLPSTQNTLTNDDFVAFANEEIDNSLVPYVLTYHENYFLTHEMIPTVSGQTRYTLPYRSQGNKARDISFVDQSGNVYEMTQILIEDESGNNSNYMAPIGGYFYKQFYIEGDEFVLPVDPNSIESGVNFKVSYYMRCNELVLESRATTVVDINRTTGVIAIANMPSNFSNSSLYDFVQVKTPHKNLGFDLPITASGNVTIGSNTYPTITMDIASIPTRLSVGDYLCLAGETPVPQLPLELHSMLAQRVACRCLDAIGDAQGLQTALQKLAEMESKAGAMLENRVEGAQLKINNRHSHLKQSRRYGFGRW